MEYKQKLGHVCIGDLELKVKTEQSKLLEVVSVAFLC